MQENKGKQYYLTVKNTITGKVETVFVSEEIYRAYKSTDRAERKRKQRMMRCTVPNDKGKLVRCQKNCAECELKRLGLVPNNTPLSLEGLIEQDFEIPDPNGDFTDKILEQRDLETERLYKAIEQLTPRQREIVELYFFKNKKQYEIAILLHISQQAINDAIQKAVKKLKEFF